MKYLSTCLFLVFSFVGTTQINGHFSFNYKFTNLSDDQVEEQQVEVYSSKNFFVISSEVENESFESAAVDRSQKKILELMDYYIDENEETQSFSSFTYQDSISDISYITDVMNYALGITFYDQEMEFLPETKLIYGLTCQKFVMTKPEINEPGGQVQVEGWVIPNSHCSIDDKQKFLDSEIGMVMEVRVVYSYDMFEVNCTGYDPDFSELNEIYTTTVPNGYTKME